MASETLTKLTPGTRVRVTKPRGINQNLQGQTLEVVQMTTDDAFLVYRNAPTVDWQLICSGEKYARPTWTLALSEVEIYSAGFASPTLKYREGDRVLEDLNTENIQLDHLILYGTFIDYRTMAGSGNNLYAYVRWDDGKEGYADEHHLQRSDKPAPTSAQNEEQLPSEVEPVSDIQPHTSAKAIAHTEVEIVPSDPTERLTQINNEMREGDRLARQGQQMILSAIAQVLNEPEILTANGYEDAHDWLEREHQWKRSNRFKAIKAAKAYVSVAGEVTELPDSINAFNALGSVPESDRPDVLEQAGGQSATADSIKAAAKPPDDLPVYTPDSSPETIREGIEQGYIVPTPDAPISAEGKPILIDDHIAHAAQPTQLIGRVTDYADGGRLEYVRMGKTLYIDAAVVVHQVSVTEAPHPSTTQSFKRGDLVQWNGRFWVVGKIQQHGDRPAGLQLLSYNAETLNNWVSADEVAIAAERDPLGLTLESACHPMLKSMVEAFGKSLVAETLETLEDS